MSQLFNCKQTGENEYSQKGKLVSELGIGPITEEQIAKVKILNEKYKSHHITVMYMQHDFIDLKKV